MKDEIKLFKKEFKDFIKAFQGFEINSMCGFAYLKRENMIKLFEIYMNNRKRGKR